MGLWDSLERKLDEIKKDIGFGDGGRHDQPQGYPGAQHPQPYYPPPQEYQQPPPQQWQAPPPGQWQQPQQPQRWAPPIPPNKPNVQDHHPPPPASGNPTDYWHPLFHPSRPVSTDWDHKLGNGVAGWGNHELQHYTALPTNSFHTADGKLILRAVSRSGAYTSARLVSRQRLERSRGCLTAIVTVPSAAGIWPALWLLPAEPFEWPGDGEVDVVESWNGEAVNHSCLHWGHFTPQDGEKHRVVDTPVPGHARRAVKYEFGWEQEEGSGEGRMVWWVDGRAVMRAGIPRGVRRLREWCVVVNVAMGGDVCQGTRPGEGEWELVVHQVRLSGECDGGWGRFEEGWRGAREGRKM